MIVWLFRIGSILDQEFKRDRSILCAEHMAHASFDVCRFYRLMSPGHSCAQSNSANLGERRLSGPLTVQGFLLPAHQCTVECHDHGRPSDRAWRTHKGTHRHNFVEEEDAGRSALSAAIPLIEASIVACPACFCAASKSSSSTRWLANPPPVGM
ncbi:hypothetical protein [Sphingobium yanoikuyae]|uniref:hypothetical protein n=1 Tax=Sphingobium yanoikuyae TaxID=13690 RepID=UPI0026EBFEAD|nr:hypothetical protein [Sphingobium yanoikuyae]